MQSKNCFYRSTLLKYTKKILHCVCKLPVLMPTMTYIFFPERFTVLELPLALVFPGWREYSNTMDLRCLVTRRQESSPTKRQQPLPYSIGPFVAATLHRRRMGVILNQEPELRTVTAQAFTDLARSLEREINTKGNLFEWELAEHLKKDRWK